MHPEGCCQLIRQVHCALEKKANNELRDADLTFAQLRLLLILKDKPEGQCSLKELEKSLGVAQSTTVGLVKRSGEKGLVDCVADFSDRRVKHVRITDKGVEVCGSMAENARRTEEWVLESLGDQEREAMFRLLARVHRAITEEDFSG